MKFENKSLNLGLILPLQHHPPIPLSPMLRLAESSFQSLSSRLGSISGCRSKVFLRPACGGVESSAEPITEIPTLQ